MFKDYNNFYIRAIEQIDLAFLTECRNDPSTWMELGSIDFLNQIKQKVWLEKSSLDSTKKYFIVGLKTLEIEEKIGFVRMDEFDEINRSIRIGADIHRNYRNKGYGTKLYKLLLEYCFNFLNVNRVWLLVLDYNDSALGLYKKMNFIEEGRQRQAIYRNGKYHD